MPIPLVTFPLLFVSGVLLAISIAGLIRMHLQEAAEHENRVLPMLHVVWVASIAFFALHGFRFF
jgi:hypothetical protein